MLATSVGQSNPTSECLSAGSVVTLRGKFVRGTFPGPPNYKSIRKGDKPEVRLLLELPSPACINDGTAKPDQSRMQKQVRRIELVLERERYAAYYELLDRKVIAKGELSTTGALHPVTPAYLTVRELKAEGE